MIKIKDKILPKKGTRYLFFSGKGGVGKSTMSCAAAVWLADKGYKTLLVTTDPAPNLSDIFSQDIGSKITKIGSVKNLSAIEIDPDIASEEYKERWIAPLKGLFDEKTIKTTKEQMDSPCVEEVAAFDKFIEFIDDPKYDVVIFDTAPTGHTIRLLQLPQGWSDEIARGGATCIGPSDSLKEAKEKYDKTISYLKDSEKTTFIFVMHAEESSFLETRRSSAELEKLGIKTSIIIINGILPDEACTFEFYRKKKTLQNNVIAKVEIEYNNSIILKYPLRDRELNGSELLLNVGKEVIENEQIEDKVNGEVIIQEPDIKIDRKAVLERIKPKGSTKYVFVTGKGGVGKSTIACATGVWASENSYRSLVVTTDPASHLQNIFGIEISYDPTRITDMLYAARVDQVQALKDYKERIINHVLERFRSSKSVKVDIEATRKKIEEELKSPCSQEMAAFEKFMSYFEIKGYDLVVIDTAPTGHTLRLLELPSMWKGFLDLGTLTKETSPETREKYIHIINIMRSQDTSTFIFVMYPEFTPIMEAWRASEELKRQVGIKTGIVAANFIVPEEHAKNNFFKRRINQQKKYIKTIQKKFDAPMIAVPVLEHEPRGLKNLEHLGKIIFGQQ